MGWLSRRKKRPEPKNKKRPAPKNKAVKREVKEK